MEKFNQIQVGKYFFGIATSTILKVRMISSFLTDEQDEEISLVMLASFFDKHNGVFPEPDGFIMEVKNGTGSQMLVIDSFSAKSITPDHFESLPKLYPDLTKICCPQVIIHEEQPLLLLDTDGLEMVRASLNNDFMEISSATLRKHYSKDKEVVDMQSTVELDEATFNTIVSWTMAEFLKPDHDEDSMITPDEKLLGAIPARHLQALDDDLLQRLIDKTIQKCRKFHTAAMQRLRQTSALIKS
jgi:hypothetical protein